MSDIVPLVLRASWGAAFRKVSPTAGYRHVDLPPATCKPCAAAARSPEHRLAERRLRQVFGCRPPREAHRMQAGRGEAALRVAGQRPRGAVRGLENVLRGWGTMWRGRPSPVFNPLARFYATPSAGGPATPLGLKGVASPIVDASCFGLQTWKNRLIVAGSQNDQNLRY